MKYVMSGYGGKSRKKKDVCFKPEEELDEIGEDIGRTLIEIFNNLRAGNACIEPKNHDGKFPCEYCKMKSVCRMGHIKTDEYETEGDED